MGFKQAQKKKRPASKAPPVEDSDDFGSGSDSDSDSGDSCLIAALINGRTGAYSIRLVRDRLQQHQLQLHTRAAEPSSSLAKNQGDAPGLKKDDLSDGLQQLQLQTGDAEPSSRSKTQGDAPGGAKNELRDLLLALHGAGFVSNAVGDAPRGGLKEEILHSLGEVYWGLDCASRSFQIFVELAVKQGYRLEFPAFSLISDDRLYGELLRLRLPTPPTTKNHAIARFEVAMFCLLLLVEHLFKRCVDDMHKIDLAKPPQASGVDKALTSLDRLRTVADLAATHADLAIPLLADLVDPEGCSLTMCHPRQPRTDASSSRN